FGCCSAWSPFRAGGERPLLLPLLPFEGRELCPGEPRLDRGAQVRLTPEPGREGDVGELDPEAPPQIAERTQLVQLEEAVEPVAGRRPIRNDERGRFEVAQHARRPACPFSRLPDRQRLHGATLSEVCQGSTRSGGEPDESGTEARRPCLP